MLARSYCLRQCPRDQASATVSSIARVSVHTAAEYRELAEKCFGWAATASTDGARFNYLNIARIWLQAAARLDDGLLPCERLTRSPRRRGWAARSTSCYLSRLSSAP